MKKVFLYAIIMAATVSCNKMEPVPVEEEEPVPEVKMITETLTGGRDIATKVTIDNTSGAFAWTAGDNIAVHVSNGESHKYVFTSDPGASGASVAEATASFTVAYEEGYARDAFAVFPSTIVSASAANYGQSGSALDVTLPASYTLAELSGETSPCPMIATNDPSSSSWDFKQICGMVRLTVNGIPPSAKRLEIDFDGKKVWGDFSIATTVTPGESVIATTADDSHDIITITKNGTDVTLNNGAWLNGLVVNIPLPTGTYTEISVTAYDALTGGDAVQATITPCAFAYTANRARAKKLTASMGFDLAAASFDGGTYPYLYGHIYQSNSGTATSNTITIADGQRILLDGVNIKAENTNAINCLGSAEIVLSGTNTVTSESDPATSGTLNYAIIKAGTYSETKTTLTISGDGILNAYPVYRSGATSPAHNGAVIGADFEGSCGNIVINSGTITVSTNYGAAIGSGRVSTGTSKCGSITINGGTITASGSTGAGIGSGGRMWVSANRGTTSCDGIIINGGTVTARSVGGAAIGAGKCEGGGTNSDSYCGDILITGGTVDARTSAGSNADGGAAIGGGYHSKAGTITISGGNVTAVGSSRSAGIGSGSRNSQCGNILINGGSVDAQGGYNSNNNEGAGIGTGRGSENNARSICGSITITNGVTIVKAYNVYGNTNRKNIGKGSLNYTQCGTVKINGVSGEIAGGSQYVYQPGA